MQKGSGRYVYEAHIEESSVIVAVKYDTKSNRMIEHERDVLRQLKHPNIISFVDCFFVNSVLYLATSFCSGKSLEYRITQRQFLEETETKEILKQVRKALMYVHEKGFVHGDVKSDNIVFDEGDVVKLCDFEYVCLSSFLFCV